MKKEEYLSLAAGDYVKICGTAKERGCFAIVQKAGFDNSVVVEFPGEDLVKTYSYKTLQIATQEEMEKAIPELVEIKKEFSEFVNKLMKTDLFKQLISTAIAEGLVFFGRKKG